MSSFAPLFTFLSSRRVWRLAVTVGAMLYLLWLWSPERQLRVRWSFTGTGIQKVVFRAYHAKLAKVRHLPGRGVIEVVARPTVGPASYHSRELTGRETPAAAWAFAIDGAAAASVLTLTARGERQVANARYCLRDIELTVPQGSEVVLEDTPLQADPGP